MPTLQSGDPAPLPSSAQLDALPQLRLREGLDLLADTWQPDTGGFIHDGLLACIWLRRAVADLASREPVTAADRIEAHVRAWLATRPSATTALCDAVRGVLRGVITDVQPSSYPQFPADLVGGILAQSTPPTHELTRPPLSPHLRI